MGYGFGGHIGVARETAWGSGTAVGSGNYIEALSEDISLSIDRFSHKAIIATLAEPDDTPGQRRIAGSIRAAGHPVSMGHFLKGALHSTSLTMVTSGVLMTTEFWSTATGADFSSEVPLQPFTFEIFRDVTSSVRYSGCLIDSLTLSIEANAALMMEATVIGRGQAVIAKTTPTFPGSPAKPFSFDTCSLSLGGAGTALIETLAIEINNNLEGIGALNLSTDIAKIRRTDHQMVNIRGTLDFTDVTEYLDFVNQTEQALNLSFTKANSFALVINIPRMVYTAFPLGIPGRERITVDFEGKGFYHTGSGTAIRAALTTTQSFF
jgi:hypothetical protein